MVYDFPFCLIRCLDVVPSDSISLSKHTVAIMKLLISKKNSWRGKMTRMIKNIPELHFFRGLKIILEVIYEV